MLPPRRGGDMRAALTETEVALSQDNADLRRQLESDAKDIADLQGDNADLHRELDEVHRQLEEAKAEADDRAAVIVKLDIHIEEQVQQILNLQAEAVVKQPAQPTTPK